MTKLLFYTFCIFTTFWLPVNHSIAHEHHHHSHDKQPSGQNKDTPQLIKEIYERALAFSPEVFVHENRSISQPYMKANGQVIPLNSAFWELVKGWIRLYRKEIQEYCPCDIEAKELIQPLKDQAAKGFLYSKVGGPLLHLRDFVVIGAYGMSAKYGKTALVLKASAEVAETALSIFVGGKGVHIICNIIDGMIIFLLRKSQIYMNVLGNSKNLNQSKLLLAFRLAWIHSVMRRANSKVFFHLESSQLNTENLSSIDAEAVKETKRGVWLSRLSAKISPLLQEIHFLDEKLAQEELLTKTQKNKLLKKRKSLQKKIEKLTRVAKKSFFGNKYKRWLLLHSRRSHPHYLKGTSFPDRATAHNWFWALSIQENIIERGFLKQIQEEPEKLNPKMENSDPIRKGLAQEFVESLPTEKQKANHISFVEKALTDIDNIFNSKLSIKQRYLLVSIIETGFVGFINHYLHLVYQDLSSSTEGLNLWNRAKLRWQVDRFVHYVFIYSDFLRTVALTRNQEKMLSYKYESMENFLLLFQFLNELAELPRLQLSKESLSAKLEQELFRLESSQVHREKRTTFSWIPFSRSLPWCHNLVRVN